MEQYDNALASEAIALWEQTRPLCAKYPELDAQEYPWQSSMSQWYFSDPVGVSILMPKTIPVDWMGWGQLMPTPALAANESTSFWAAANLPQDRILFLPIHQLPNQASTSLLIYWGSPIVYPESEQFLETVWLGMEPTSQRTIDYALGKLGLIQQDGAVASILEEKASVIKTWMAAHHIGNCLQRLVPAATSGAPSGTNKTGLQQHPALDTSSNFKNTLRSILRDEFMEFDKGLQEYITALDSSHYQSARSYIADRLRHLTYLDEKKEAAIVTLRFPKDFFQELQNDLDSLSQHVAQCMQLRVADLNAQVNSKLSKVLIAHALQASPLHLEATSQEEVQQLFKEWFRPRIEFEAGLRRKGLAEFSYAIRKPFMLIMMMLSMLNLSTNQLKGPNRFIHYTVMAGLVFLGFVVSMRDAAEERRKAYNRELNRARMEALNLLRSQLMEALHVWRKKLSSQVNHQIQAYLEATLTQVDATPSHATGHSKDDATTEEPSIQVLRQRWQALQNKSKTQWQALKTQP